MPALRIVSGREMRNDTRLRRPSKNLLVAIEVSIVGWFMHYLGYILVCSSSILPIPDFG